MKEKKLDIITFDQLEKFGFKYINCFNRIVFCEIERLIPGSGKKFLVLYHLAKSFPDLVVQYLYKESQIDGFAMYPDAYSEIHFMNSILQTYFGLSLTKIVVSEEALVQTIYYLLDRNQVAFVPIDLSTIYYSENYLESPMTHWLYCYGHFSEKKIIHILDQMHFGINSVIYKPFVISNEMLTSSHKSYSTLDSPSANSIFTIERFHDEILHQKTNDFFEILYSLIQTLAEVVQNKANVRVIEWDAFMNDDFEMMFSLRYIKEIYHSFLLELLEPSITEQDKKVINYYYLNIRELWDEVSRDCQLSIYRDKPLNKSKFFDVYEHIMKQESLYFSTISKCLSIYMQGE